MQSCFLDPSETARVVGVNTGSQFSSNSRSALRF